MSINVKRWPKLSRLREERGQTLVLFALALSSLVLALGLAVDLGFAYVTKAKLSKSVDAACLTAMRNLAQGQTTATTLATNSFNANYRATSLDANPPALAINFSHRRQRTDVRHRQRYRHHQDAVHGFAAGISHLAGER